MTSGKPPNRPSAKEAAPVAAAFALFFAALLFSAAGCQSPGAAGFAAVEERAYDAASAPAAGEPAVRAGLVMAKNLEQTGAEWSAAPEMNTGGGAGAETTAPQERERLVIYTADLQIRVANLDGAKERFLDLAESAGGYLQQQQDHTLIVRVPAARFEEVIGAVKELGSVLRENLAAQDITLEFVDLEIRLDNAVKARDRLVELLERADKVADLLEVEKEMKRLTEEIESLKGRIRYFRDQVAFSTVAVAFNGPQVGVPPARRHSRFDWINRIGAEYVLENF